MTPPKHILVVDHDGDVRGIIADLLMDLGYRVSSAEDGPAMRGYIESSDRVDLMVLDANSSALEAVSLAVQARDEGIRLVMVSGSLSLMQEYHDRADQLLHKPFSGAELERAVQHAFGSDTFGQRKADAT
jgi:two-component system, OmpR family, response regulator